MSRSGSPSLLSFGKVVVAVFVVFLISEEGERLLSGAALKPVHLLMLSFGIAYIATPLAHWLAHRVGALDTPGGRKTHEAPTALMGGVAIYIAFTATVLSKSGFGEQLTAVVLAATLIFIVGLIDDLRELPATFRLLVQLAAVVILMRYGVVVTFLPAGFWGSAGEWLFTAVWIIGITNAVNFLDGMDGLAAGTCCISASFFGLVALQNSQVPMIYLAIPLAGACLGYLPYNFRPRRRAVIFMGDAGSTFLGFTMASLAGWVNGRETTSYD